MLTGTEVKSLRAGRASLVDGFATIERRRGVAARRAHPRVHPGHLEQPRAPPQVRKLLLHHDEIARLASKTRESGLTLVPLSLYFKDGYAKVEIALARGKKSYDKRQTIAERDATRETARAVGRRAKGHDE